MLLGARLALAAPVIPLTDTGETLEAAGTRASFLALGTGARAISLGGAYAAVADDATALDWNPAGLGQLTGLSAVAMHQSFDAGMSWSTLNLGRPLGPGVAGLSVGAYRFGAYEIRDDLGVLTGTGNDTDLAFAAGWAMENPAFLGGDGWWGVSAQAVTEAAAGTGFAGTAGILYPLTRAWTAGLAVQRLGAGDRMPASVRAGALFTPVWFPASAMLDVSFGLGDQALGVSAGLEIRPHRLVALRAGYRHDSEDQGYGGLAGVAAGAGIRWRSLGIDYAFQPFGDLTTTHRIALVYAAEPARPRSATPTSASVPAAASPTAESEYQAAVALYASRDYDGAWRRANTAIALDANHWQAWQLVGNCRYAKGDVSGAITSYRRSLSLHPDNPGLKAFVDGLEKK